MILIKPVFFNLCTNDILICIYQSVTAYDYYVHTVHWKPIQFESTGISEHAKKTVSTEKDCTVPSYYRIINTSGSLILVIFDTGVISICLTEIHCTYPLASLGNMKLTVS